MHCSSNSELPCRVILIGLLQGLKYNQLFIYLAFVKIWDAWNELNERYCGNPTTLLWSAPWGQQDNPLHFNALFWFLAGGNVKCWMHQLPTPHKQNRSNRESQNWKHLTNELLIIATFQTHSSAEKEKTKNKKPQKNNKKIACVPCQQYFVLSYLSERCILVSCFQITKSCGMLTAKGFNLPDFNYCKHSLFPLPLSI